MVNRWRSRISLFLRAIFRRAEVERDLEDEFRDHIERQAAANIVAGMSPHEARRCALVAFGGVERIKDESRDVRGLSIADELRQFRFALRSLARARVYTVAAVATIALAVAAGSAMFTLVNAVLLRPLPFPNSDRIVGVWVAFPGFHIPLAGQAAGSFDAFHRYNHTLDAMGVVSEGAVVVSTDDGTLTPTREPLAAVSGALFPVLGAQALIGRAPDASDTVPGAQRIAVISERYWRTAFGASRAVLGRHVRIEGMDHEIVGVLSAAFAFPASNTNIWATPMIDPGRYVGSFGLRVIGRLKPGVTIDAARSDLQTIFNRLPELYPEVRPGEPTAGAFATAQPHVIVHRFRDDIVAGFERVLWLIAAVAGVLVIVAASNMASLTLARVEARGRELAVRSTLGASRGRLWWSMLAETLIVTVVGTLIGTVLAIVAVRAVAALGPTDLPAPAIANGGDVLLPRLNEVRLGAPLFAAAAIIGAMLALTAAVVGTWRAQLGRVLVALREGGRGSSSGRGAQRTRAAFVMTEVALSMMLLSGSLVLARSLAKLLTVNPGFDSTNVFTIWVRANGPAYHSVEDVLRFYRDVNDRVARVPGVIVASIASKPPLQYGQTTRPMWVDDAPPASGGFGDLLPLVDVSARYFAALRIPVLAGRTFDDANVKRGDDEIVISRSVSEHFWHDSSGARALGRIVRVNEHGAPLTIVGVVGDVRDTALAGPAQGVVYLPQETGPDSLDVRPQRSMAVVVRTQTRLPAVAAAVEEAIRSVDPRLPTFNAEWMTDTVAKAGRRARLMLMLLGAGALTTLVLGAVGLYGVIAYSVTGRTREIGVRLALGLAPHRATLLVLRQGAVIVAVGAAVGGLAFGAFAQLLRTLVYDVSVRDSVSVASAAVLVIVVAGLATWLPAARAAGIDPAEALRAE